MLATTSLHAYIFKDHQIGREVIYSKLVFQNTWNDVSFQLQR